MIKRFIENSSIRYEVVKEHSKNCIKLAIDYSNDNSEILKNYEDFKELCNKYMNTIECYSKKEIKKRLLEIYKNNKFNFEIKPYTLDYIINDWKKNSNKFTKFIALENAYNQNDELILWDHRNPILYVSNKKNQILSEYFIWSHNQIIARARLSKHFFVDGTFHHPSGYEQLLIILFKDVIINEYIPCFFVLMKHKYEFLYNLIFQSIKYILTQNNLYNLLIETITTDQENALINGLKNNFANFQNILCFFHYKHDILLNAKKYGLLNHKIDSNELFMNKEVIKQLSLLPFNYNGDIKEYDRILSNLSNYNKKCYNFIYNYFDKNKKNGFINNSYNYNNIPIDVKSNSILERYNLSIKKYFGNKRECSWINFMNFINTEIEENVSKLSKNENKNILYYSKYTKFKEKKYNYLNNRELQNSTPKKKITINENWLVNKGFNCRYISFVTIYYFNFLSYINNLQGDKFKNLKKLNDLVLKLSQDVNINNLNSIIEFFQKNKYDIDNDLLDKIKKETDKRKLPKLIDQLKNNTKINYYSSGYICSLFNIFADLDNFCIVEKKFEECVLCKRKEEKIIKPYRLFLTILEEDMKETSLLNILFKKYRSKNINYCKCKEKNQDDLL